jgi:hypothetical protein
VLGIVRRDSVGGDAIEHPAGHPNIRRALHALEAAETDLKAAPHDFGGHRVDALAACDKAIEQSKICLKHVAIKY